MIGIGLLFFIFRKKGFLVIVKSLMFVGSDIICFMRGLFLELLL